MTEQSSAQTKTADRAVVVTRTVDAPRELVWKAWTEPARVMRWWGPKDFTSPRCEIDLRTGGTYLNCMRSPDGQDTYSTGVYREIIPLERLVYTDRLANADGSFVPPSHYGLPADTKMEALVTVTFEDHEGKTKLTLTHAGLPSGEISDMAVTVWNQALDKLAKSLHPFALAATLRQQMDEVGVVVSGVDEDVASRRAADGSWSVKECLSHLQGADGDTFLDSVRRFLDEGTPEIDVEPGVTHFDASRQAMTVAQLASRVQAQYRAIADVLAGASAEDLGRTAHIPLFAQTPFGDHPTLAQFVGVISGMHVAGHLEDMRGRR